MYTYNTMLWRSVELIYLFIVNITEVWTSWRFLQQLNYLILTHALQ